MLYFILSLALVVAVIFAIRFAMLERYDKLIMGTIVGKYKGTSNGGYVVVEARYRIKASGTWLPPVNVSSSATFEVPLSYYDKCKIGDEGIFPFELEGEVV